jgi:hypothetical protein
MKRSKGMQLGALLAAMLLVSIALVPAVSAQAENSITPQTNEVNLTGPNVVFFNTSNLTPIENRQRLIIQGNKTSTGACQFTSILNKTAAEASIIKIMREVAVNRDTCQQLVDVGTLKNPPAEPGNLIVYKAAQQYSTPSSLPTRTASMTTNWWDPIGIKVNYNFDQISFSYDGNMVYGLWSGFSHDYYRPTHWYEVYYNLNSYLTPNPNAVYQSSSDHYENDWFMGVTTNTYYQPNTIIGYPNGAISAGGSYTWDDGPIWYLLHYEQILQ